MCDLFVVGFVRSSGTQFASIVSNSANGNKEYIHFVVVIKMEIWIFEIQLDVNMSKNRQTNSKPIADRFSKWFSRVCRRLLLIFVSTHPAQFSQFCFEFYDRPCIYRGVVYFLFNISILDLLRFQLYWSYFANQLFGRVHLLHQPSQYIVW